MASAAPEPWTETDEDEYGVTPTLVRDVREALEAGDAARVRALVEDLHAADLADLLGQLETEERYALVEAMGSELDPQVLPELDGAIRDQIVAYLQPEELAAAVQELDTDDALEVVADLDEDQREALLARLPEADRLVIDQGLTYPERTAGRLMQRELVAIPAFWTVGETIDFMRVSPT